MGAGNAPEWALALAREPIAVGVEALVEQAVVPRQVAARGCGRAGIFAKGGTLWQGGALTRSESLVAGCSRRRCVHSRWRGVHQRLRA